MRSAKLKEIVSELITHEELPTLEQLMKSYNMLDAMSIQAGIVVAGIQARINLTEPPKDDDQGLVYFEENQSHFPK